MSAPDYDPRGNANVGDILEPDYPGSLEQLMEVFIDWVRWHRQREPVNPGDPFTKFATRGWLVQKGLLTEAQVLGDDDGGVDDSGTEVEREFIVTHAREMYPSTTDGADALTSLEITSAKPNVQYIAFPPGVDTSAEFQLIMPAGWPGNTFQYRLYWEHGSSGTAFGVKWSLQGHSATDQEDIGSDFADGGQTVDTGGTAHRLYITAESNPIIISGTATKPGDLIFLRITRLGSQDTLDIDARLLAIRFNLGTAPVEFPPPASAGELYLRFEADFLDSSVAGRTVTEHGTPNRSTSHPGGGSESLVGDGASYLSVVDDGAFDIGARIFQIRFHLYIETAASLATDNVIIGKWGASDGSWFINLDSTGRLYLGRKAGSYFFDALTGVLARDTMMQFTIWRPTVGGQVYCAKDGIVYLFPISSALTFDTTTNDLAIGATIGGIAPLPAGVYLDEVQFQIDATDYTTVDFTPPTPPYT